MKKIRGLLEKLKNYFKKILGKQEILLIEENNNSKQEIVENLDKEKSEFFELYNNVKNGTISIENLMLSDLIKVQLMMQKELNIYDEKITDSEDEIIQIEKEIEILQKQI